MPGPADDLAFGAIAPPRKALELERGQARRRPLDGPARAALARARPDSAPLGA